MVVDPGIGFFEAGAQGYGGFPAEPLFDKGVVTATATDAFWSVEFVTAFELDAGDVFNDVHQLVSVPMLMADFLTSVSSVLFDLLAPARYSPFGPTFG